MATTYTTTSFTLKALVPSSYPTNPRSALQLTSPLRFNSLSRPRLTSRFAALRPVRAAVSDGDYSSKRSSSNEPRETIMLPGCDYNHWLIVMEFPKDPAPTREQMIDTYLNTLATVLGRYTVLRFSFSCPSFDCRENEKKKKKRLGI